MSTFADFRKHAIQSATPSNSWAFCFLFIYNSSDVMGIIFMIAETGENLGILAEI